MKYKFIFLIMLAACGNQKTPLEFSVRDMNQGNVEETVTPFSNFKTKILEPHCLKCHANKNTKEAIEAWIKPGSPEDSPLYTSVKVGWMPKGADPLSTADLEVIREYILQTSLTAPQNPLE